MNYACAAIDLAHNPPQGRKGTWSSWTKLGMIWKRFMRSIDSGFTSEILLYERSQANVY